MQAFLKTELRVSRFFTYAHLPEHLQIVSKPFCDLANQIYDNYLQSDADEAETEAGLRKLLEAKDCVVRSLVK